ncbi:acid phosphatase/Vanadium-dependent haloperoxidase [Ascobolus immersus RN42]|uniref:Acid phosphatase/Vanadium-dependent haloperoxidase n=1 Tax=Ascobolus immersus RN42 TaxID=1160509 RepID=A0A3N4HPR9_ASCIM|nr:acid phosphatase/Vanadium-dependent haloperoxidase [Ascobolus immersus RN42]
MKSITLALAGLITTVAALYPGDIVQYWNYKTLYTVNTTLSGPHSSYIGAFVHTAILAAAEEAERQPRSVQQLAVSYAAHDALHRHFYAQYQSIDSYLREIEDAVGDAANAQQSNTARRIGEAAAAKVAKARADDGMTTYVRYEFKPPAVGVYQPTPPGFPFPSAQNTRYAKPFGGIKSLPVWKGPPDVKSRDYEAYLKQVKEKGAKNNSTRTDDETEIGYYWMGSPVFYWNNFATQIIGDSTADNILESAQFYAKLNWAMFNAAIMGFTAKNKYDAWRPVTALHWEKPFLRSGRSYYTPDWEPLLPTPGHQEYLSGHSVFAASAAAIIRRQIGGDSFGKLVRVTIEPGAGPFPFMTRRFTSLSQMVKENGDSRVFVGAHFLFACEEGNAAGEKSAELVWKRGAKNYL